MLSNVVDVVASDDIERAIRKSLVDEISRHSILDEEKTRTVYHWVSALMKYLPLRKVIFDFLKELRHLFSMVSWKIFEDIYLFL